MRIFIIYLVSLLSIFGTVPAAEPARGGVLHLCTSSDPRTFNPITAQETSSLEILNFIFEGLTTMDFTTGEVRPLLAQSWLCNGDGTIWVIRLREGLRWSDGVPFTADDVVFTFEKIIFNPDVVTSAKSIFMLNGRPIRVTKMDERTVRFVLPIRFSPFIRALGQPILPRHIVEPYIREKKFNEAWHVGSPLKSIVGTGPFVLSRYIPGEYIELSKNTQYWKRDAAGTSLPYLDKVVFSIIPNADTALLKFKNKEIDIYSLRGIDYPWLKSFEKREQFTVYSGGPALSSFFLSFNQNRAVHQTTHQPNVPAAKLKWFTNANFRRAIAHGIDYAQIIQGTFQGLAVRQYADMSPSSGYFFNPNVPKYEYDPAAARQLLAAEGFRDVNQDGILEDAEGNPISFTLTTNADNATRIQIAQLIRKDLAALGMQVNVSLVEFNTLVSKLTFTCDWDAVLMGFSGTIEPHFGSNVWTSDGPLHLWYPRQSEPVTSWEKRIDEIFDAASKEINQEKRKKLYDEWQEIVADEVPFIYTAIPLRFYAVSNRVKNCLPVPLGGVLWNVEELWMETAGD